MVFLEMGALFNQQGTPEKWRHSQLQLMPALSPRDARRYSALR
jgi:hypothetical protein